MISLKAVWDAFQKHTHTLTSLGAAAANHTHTLQSLGAAPANHTHTSQSLGLGLQMVADGQSGALISAEVPGKTLGVLYITTRGRWYPVTFAIEEFALGANLLNRGGENADRDYDAIVNLALNGTTLTITRAGNTNGLGRLYVM